VDGWVVVLLFLFVWFEWLCVCRWALFVTACVLRTATTPDGVAPERGRVHCTSCSSGATSVCVVCSTQHPPGVPASVRCLVCGDLAPAVPHVYECCQVVGVCEPMHLQVPPFGVLPPVVFVLVAAPRSGAYPGSSGFGFVFGLLDIMRSPASPCPLWIASVVLFGDG